MRVINIQLVCAFGTPCKNSEQWNKTLHSYNVTSRYRVSPSPSPQIDCEGPPHESIISSPLRNYYRNFYHISQQGSKILPSVRGTESSPKEPTTNFSILYVSKFMDTQTGRFYKALIHFSSRAQPMKFKLLPSLYVFYPRLLHIFLNLLSFGSMFIR